MRLILTSAPAIDQMMPMIWLDERWRNNWSGFKEF
jgi:hypothetical protein